MKAYLHTILLACLLTACAQPLPDAPPAPPAPAPVIEEGRLYRVTEYNPNGTPSRKWLTSNYRETDFPRTVTFTSATGEPITLRGSYEIDEVLK